MMIKDLKLTKRRKLLGAVAICVALITGLTMLWQMGQVAEAAILDPHPGLVGWWRFDEEAGNIAEDSSGYGNHGTVYGATWVDGKYGKALSFDGIDNYVLVPGSESLAIISSITIEAWVKAAAYTWLPILQKDSNDATHWAGVYVLEGHNNKLRFVINHNWRTGDDLHSTSSLPIDEWVHVAGVFDGENMSVYINGVLDKSQASESGSINTSTQPLRVGRRAQTYCNCVIDEVRVYNRDLSATEIQEIFQKGPDFSSTLLAKVPKGTTQVITTVSWQGSGSIDITIESPSETYTEDMVQVYQKNVYSSSSGDMLNIKRLAVSVTALSSDEDWYVMLETNDVEDYRITIEIST